MNSGLYSVLYLMYFIILDSVLYFADIDSNLPLLYLINKLNAI